MRRRARKAIVNISLFTCALLLIIYLNYQPSKTAFAWTTIRYETKSTSLPEARGICPGLPNVSKPALIVSRVAADGKTGWLASLASKYHICIYSADAPADVQSSNLQVPANRGHEAMGYLTFIIDNYENIPAAGAVFVHGSRWAWHNDHPEYDNAALLAALNVSAALEPAGYHNMRCDWSASTCLKSSVPQGSLENSLNAMMQPWDARVVSEAALPGVFATLFGGDLASDRLEASAGTDGLLRKDQRLLLSSSEAVRAQCCAQFVVAQDRIRQHSHSEYVALRQWLLDEGVAPRDDRVAGRILSYLWHVLFIAPDPSSTVSDGVYLEQLNAKACPRADECYCRLYGRCNLQGCSDPARCSGQYVVPSNFKLPKDWEASHS